MENPFKELLDGINKNFKELETMFAENQKAMDKIKTNPLSDSSDPSNATRENAKLKDEDFMRNLAEFCLGDLDTIVLTLQNRMDRNGAGMIDAAVFMKVIKEEDRNKIFEKLSDKEKYIITKEIDEMPECNRMTTETILFNIQAEYFSRLDGENPDIDLFNDLFK